MIPAPDKLTATLLQLWDAGPRGISTAGVSPAHRSLHSLADASALTILKNLRAHGCLIEESPAGGGRIELQRAGLGAYRDLIEALAARHHWTIGRKAVVYHRTTSTNDVCLRHTSHTPAHKAAPEGPGLVAIADAQSRGRGRRGHAWSARPGQSVLMSILLRDVPTLGVDRLTLLAGLAGAEAIESVLHSFGGSRIAAGSSHAVQIKWPNDLLLATPEGSGGGEGGGGGGGGARKVAGILVERRGPHAVVGIGVNVAQGPADFPVELRATATSLYRATGQQIDRLRVIVALLQAFNLRCATITDDDAWVGQWKARCPMLGQQIRAREIGGRKGGGKKEGGGGEGHEVVGRVQDIDPLRGLLVRDTSGAMRWLAAQTTTLSA